MLGGIEAVKRRFKSEDEEVRIAALEDALNYGDEGLDLLIEALKDDSEEVKDYAVSFLQERGGEKGKQALLNYNPWIIFTSFKTWKCISDYYSYDCISGRTYNAYLVSDKKTLKYVTQDSKSKYLKALNCYMSDKDPNSKQVFKDYVETIVNSQDILINLKALLIGDKCHFANIKYIKSNIIVSNIVPLLKAYPNLELLHIRGRMDKEDVLKSNSEILSICNHHDNSTVTVKSSLKHESLKTLIIDADGISDSNLAKLCNLNLPSLEYLEIWLSRSNLNNINIDSLAPILSSKYCHNLAYLGIRKSSNTSELAKAIIKSPIMKNLKVLELTDGNMGSGGVIALLESPEINNLHTLNVSGNRLNQSTIEQLSKLDCRVIAESQFSDRYYTVWE